MKFRVYDREDEYDTVEADRAEEHDDGIAFYGSNGQLCGWFAKDMTRGFHAASSKQTVGFSTEA